MNIDYTRIRNYELYPLGSKEQIPQQDLYYLYIELNLCTTQISQIVHRSPTSIQKQCKKWGFHKSKQMQKESIENMYLEKYGVKNPAQLESSKQKMKQTMLNRYGVENIAHSQEHQQKKKETCLEKYGVDNPAKNEQILQKTKQTNLSKYDVEWVPQNKQIRQKQLDTMLQRYNVLFPYEKQEFIQKAKNTCLEKYGQDNIMKTEEGLQKFKQSFLQKYGVSNPMQYEQFLNKCFLNSFGDNFGQSKEEYRILELLKIKFSNVQYQYKCERYPFFCDFYLPEQDIFIEYQGFVAHGSHPFNESNAQDQQQLNFWQQKAQEKLQTQEKTSYTEYIITWTIKDPLKRLIALESNLNWFEFFTLKEFMEWYDKY